MEKFSFEKINELIEYLQGTCNSLDDGINEILGEGFCSLDLSLENHDQIDNEIFLCENCGWWYEIIEESESESGVCESCYEE